MYKTKKQQYEIIRGQLALDRSSFESHWRDLNDYILPRRGRFFVSDVNKGDRRNQKIIDSTATLSARTLRSGLMSGITSPARPWFRLTTPDPALAEYGSVKQWLHDCSNRMSSMFLRSNIYNSLPTLYGDTGVFGTGCMSMEEDSNSVIHTQSFPIGSYFIGKDHRGRINTFFREFRMTVRQLVEKFGKKDNETGKPDWSVFSMQVKDLWDRGEYETWIDVCHVIMPNADYNPQKLAAKFKKFSSCYYESGARSAGSNNLSIDGKMLSESGYDYFPILAPRWEVTGEDVYGTDCPGMTALGDIKQLQTGEKRSAQAIEKMINPPMVGPTSMRNSKNSILPGDISYADIREGQQGFRPAHEVNFRIQELEGKQEQIRQRVRRAFFEDLFLMLASRDDAQRTATEIVERKEEKLLALGPVLEQMNIDLLDPIIDIGFDIMARQDLLPPAPEELQGVPLKVEYISVMAQAQKLVGISGLERFSAYVGQMAAYNPEALDKFDLDQAIDVYGEMTAVAPGIIRTDDAVAAIRQQKARAQQAQMAPAIIQQGASAAKDLSQANLEGDSALSALMQSGGQSV